MNKLFTVAGASVQDGAFKYRFANSHDRAQVLARAGHTWVKLFTLPTPMYKEDAARWLDDNYPNLVAESASDSKFKQRLVKSKPADQLELEDAQWAIWRARAVKKHSFLQD